MSREVQFNKAENPDGTQWYPDDISLFSDTKPHPQDNTKIIATYTGTDETIVDFDGYFQSNKRITYREFMQLFGAVVYAQIMKEYRKANDEDVNLIFMFDMAKANGHVELSAPDTSLGLDVLVANNNVAFTSSDKAKILQNIAL